LGGAVPEEAAEEIAWGAAATLDGVLFEFDVEGGEHAGDALVGEAALAEAADLTIEEVDNLGAGKAFLVGAGGFAKFASDDSDLFGGVGASLCHGIPYEVIRRRESWRSLPGEVRLGPSANGRRSVMGISTREMRR
jgi:hypothetical protein